MKLRREADGLSQQLIDASKREGVDTYTATMLLHASSLIDRLTSPPSDGGVAGEPGSDDWFSEHRPKLTISVEAGARAIARSQGHDPDDLAPRTTMCTADNAQVPWWKVFEEEAEACLATVIPLPGGVAGEPVAWLVNGPLDYSEVFLIHGNAVAAFSDWGKRITPLYRIDLPPVPGNDGREADYRIAKWLSKFNDDPNTDGEFVSDINAWFEAHEPWPDTPAHPRSKCGSPE